VNQDLIQQYLDHPNVKAFLRAIRLGESDPDTDEAYVALFGWSPGNGRVFNDFGDHPRQRTYEKFDGQFIKNNKIDYTTAAGAYQIVETTWNNLRRNNPWLIDFSPHMQDLAAVVLLVGRGAINHVINGNIPAAIAKLGDEWASLPSSTVGQPTKSLEKLLAVYLRYGGVLAGEQAPTPPAADESSPGGSLNQPQAPVGDPTQYSQEAGMPIPAVALALLPSLIEAIPKLGSLFGSGSKVAERNVAGVGLALDIVQKSVGAVNAQAAVEALADPAKREVAAKAIEDNWYQLTEAGGGGIDGARKADAAAVASHEPVWRSPSFVVAVGLLPLVYMIVGAVVGLFGAPFSDDVRSAIANGIVGLILGGLIGYYYGQTTSRNRSTVP